MKTWFVQSLHQHSGERRAKICVGILLAWQSGFQPCILLLNSPAQSHHSLPRAATFSEM